MIRLVRALVLVAALTPVATQALAGEETRKMEKPALFVMDHLGGVLAVNLDRVLSVFYLPGSPEKPARLRLNLPGGEDKTVNGPAAEPLWKTLRESPHAGAFLWVSHMSGTLGIPVRNIQSVFKSGEGAGLSVRINHPGDPQGKTVRGAEAAEVWERLAE